MKPRALDLFCGAGGASMGLHRAGFDVVGVDIKPQPHYPFEFICEDALHLTGVYCDFDFIWASPPCQAHVGFNASWNDNDHDSLIAETRGVLARQSVPYVIENVVGSPLRTTIQLCGSHFGLGVRRHRRFESSFILLQRPCQHYGRYVGVYGDHPQGHYGDGYRIPRARSLAEAQEAMGIDWMTWKEITQAIPPAYSEFIGRAALAYVESGSKAA